MIKQEDGVIRFKQISPNSLLNVCYLDSDNLNEMLNSNINYTWMPNEIDVPAYILMNINFNVLESLVDYKSESLNMSFNNTSSVNKAGAWFNSCDELVVAIRKFYVETCNYYKTTEIVSLKLTYLKVKKNIPNV